ncbi:MAG: hypothetical protein QF362_00615 [Candidatus Woesearchaeota archaeon]|jgi:thiol-disulfide isomerase/thioredoxin|nr:hypothetical protein [Candidatus Woesearchaeota archaeon]MDP7505933.1 hypothetical protein [Candidatus Woesearchaeota archaeon]|tara:strand:- start:24526 stop:25770 length:1245 start_codon:yes stop_codon:yes gene_type:complete
MEEHHEHKEHHKQSHHHESEEHHEHRKHHKTHHKKRRVPNRSFYNRMYITLGVVLILFMLYNLSQTLSINITLDQKIANVKEAAKPAEISLTVISTSSCKDCYDINSAVEVIESIGVSVTSKEIDFSSEEAKALIAEHTIEKVPTVIVTGEIDKSSSLKRTLGEIGKESGDAYVFTSLEPPFIETKTGMVRGKISLVHLKKESCDDCIDLAPLISQLSASGLILEESEEIDVDSTKGKELVKKYSVEKIPTIIMDKEAEVYPNIVQSWSQLGSVEGDGSYVMREVSSPYYSIEEEAIKGLISMIILSDETCEECYDGGEFHSPVLQRMGITFKEEDELDVSSEEGKELVEKYSINLVPTIIITGDIEEYPVLVSAWVEVGTEESDGNYVFRKVEIANQPYKNLTDGKVVGSRTE